MALLRADHHHLRTRAYATDEGLVARTSLYEHQRPRIDLVAEALDLLGDVDGALVADVGCGNGRYVGALAAAGATVVGADLSVGMLRAVPDGDRHLLVADAARLPFRAGSLDVVLQMHMLYHLPEPAEAIDEARRALRPGGRLLVATNGADHLAELAELWSPLLSELALEGQVEDLVLVNARFPADEARSALVGLAHVEERTLRSQVVTTDAAPVVRHAASTTDAHLSAEAEADLTARFASAVEAVIAREGRFRITTEVVLFVGTTRR